MFAAALLSGLILGQAGSAGDRPAAPPAPPLRTLDTRRELQVAPLLRGVLAADLDGDGAAELILTRDDPGGLGVLRGLGRGLDALGRTQWIDVDGYPLGPEPWSPGRVVLCGRTSHVLQVVRAAGADPAIEAQLQLGGRPRALATTRGDDRRAAVCTDAGQALLIRADRQAQASAGLVLERELPLSDLLPICAAFVDGDSLLAVGGQAGPGLELLDLRVPARAATLIALPGIPRDLGEFDYDADGDLELIAVGGDRTAWVFGLERDGGLRALLDDPGAPAELPGAALPIALASGDLDGDGRAELAAAYHGAQVVSVLGGFGGEAELSAEAHYAGAAPSALAIADLDGDGIDDLAVVNPPSAAISLFFGTPAGVEHPLDYPTLEAPHSMAVGDLDGDGRPEVALLSALDDRLAVMSADAGGALTERLVVAVPPAADRLCFADLDGDGHQDLAFLCEGPRGSTVHHALGDGRGGLAPSSAELPRIDGLARGLIAADVDGDGRAELLVTNTSRGRLEVLRDGAPGASPRLQPEDGVEVGPGASALCAIPGPDGELLGIAVAIDDPGGRHGVRLVRVGPAGALEPGLFLALDRAPEDLASADVDGDGTPDIVVLQRGLNDNASGRVRVALAPGSGGDWDLGPELPTGPKPFHLAAGDVDGDGCAEVFASSQYGHSVRAWRGTRDRRQPLAPSFDLGAGRGCMGLALVDVDGDGDLDLLVGNNHSGDVSVLLAHR